MAYEYEIFFSYKRDNQSIFWHEKIRDIIIHYVREEPDIDQVRVFFDTEEIRTGNRWREKIASAIQRSKCMIGIWSPQYFRSKHCVAEWLCFSARSELTNKELVAPASRWDGINFPPRARELQIADFNKYSSVLMPFWETKRAADFEDEKLKPFASDVARLIRAAPDYSPDFPIIDADSELPSNAYVAEKIKIDRIANVEAR